MTDWRRVGSIVFALLAGCAGSAPAPQPPAAAAPASEVAQPQPLAAEPVQPSDLNGTWVEYWAIDGRADTERYLFTGPDHFAWQAAKESPSDTVGKSGRFRLEPHGTATFLVLEVAHETLATCAAPPCPASDAPRALEHRSPRIERHELGECPNNPEAKNLDASYTCRAIGGKAFWRKTRDPSASQPSAAPAAG